MSDKPRTLAVFDYSGTLSRDAARFATLKNLRRALQRSGLAELGVSEPAVFWEQIVNPTWRAGSTTSIGYVELIVERLTELSGRSSTSIDVDTFRTAGERFVTSYLEESSLYRRWRPLLGTLLKTRNTVVLVATDHYAEATPAILDHLRRAGIAGYRVGAAPTVGDIGVANSADLGATKSHVDFWRKAVEGCSARNPERVILIDDFGCNEDVADAYTAEADRRRDATAAALAHAVGCDPLVVPFRPRYSSHEAWDAEIRRAEIVLTGRGD
ncbi:MAG: hypothetical protein MI724_17765 [Spirochaetales bacterium]|nr:hypothetical protein [Spirochaetales bacterium]